jgi:hypothetical protein
MVIDIASLSEWLVDVLRKLVGLRVPTYDRRAGGERVLLVETYDRGVTPSSSQWITR